VASEFVGIYNKMERRRRLKIGEANVPPDIKILRQICKEYGVFTAFLLPNG